ncbi:nucleotide binding protein 1 [Heterostelium album PN500]|uniref:Nucleotide binding protein 1 n=1 Tax=Heterostelium pallidum (strain ATCC 26659 / Pp 5 / PN500) TaxID=670386 RepID=D3BV53_HETP5|nr:nucleotide binding protein 1 [Heterostelium album PN500]EFA74991.1 nucleotide binding protein 1 [Heterostelium album PN500]|eukprot:XP_020427125.1 nucleotide binding protein 1 [Heterostelium album PN500]
MSGCGKSQCCGGGGCGSKSNNQQPQQQQQQQETNSEKKNVNIEQFIASDSVELKYGTEDQMVTFKGCPSSTGQVGQESVCQGCPGKDLCSSQQTENTDKKAIDIRMKVIKHKLLVLSGKGGVGKSSVASLLTYSLAARNKKVALLDVDICGPSIPKLMGIEGLPVVNSEAGWTPLKPRSPGHQNIAVMSVGALLANSDNSIVWRGPRKTNIINRFLKDTFWGRQDFLVVDTPPGTSDEHLSVVEALSGSCKPDGAIIVTTPQDLSVDTVKREINFCLKMGIKILGIVENLSGYACPCCEEITEIFKSEGGIKLANQYNIPFLGKIPIDTNLGYCAENGKCLVCDFPNSSSTKSILDITDKLLSMLS